MRNFWDQVFADANPHSATINSKCHKQIDHKSIDSILFFFARSFVDLDFDKHTKRYLKHVFVEAITDGFLARFKTAGEIM